MQISPLIINIIDLLNDSFIEYPIPYILIVINKIMFKSPQKSHSNEQFYAKRLNTESFLSPEVKNQISYLSEKMEHQIQVVKKNLRVKNLRMFKAKEKKRTIENQQQQMRDTLRSKLDIKMKMSETNLEKMMVKKTSQSKSKEKMRETTLSRIKSNQKSLIEQSFRKSKRFSQDTEKYLLDRKCQQTLEKVTSLDFNPSKTRYNDEEVSFENKSTVNESRKRIFPHILVITDRQIKQKQKKKNNLSEEKDIKNLHEYIQKLNYIDKRREIRALKLADTVKLLQKQRKQEQLKYESRRKEQPNQPRKSSYCFNTAAKTAIKNKFSFLQIYSKKLEEKLIKKANFEEEAVRLGNQLINRQFKAKKQRNEKRMFNETIKQVQQKINFQFMQNYNK